MSWRGAERKQRQNMIGFEGIGSFFFNKAKLFTCAACSKLVAKLFIARIVSGWRSVASAALLVSSPLTSLLLPLVSLSMVLSLVALLLLLIRRVAATARLVK